MAMMQRDVPGSLDIVQSGAGTPEIKSTAVERISVIAAVVLAVFYLATSLYIASQRLFWFDELFTIHIARVPDWVAIWTALHAGVDSLPPVYYMVVRCFGSLFGPGEVAARMPSALAMVAGMLITFDCARRLTDGLHGLIALSVLTCSFLLYYGYEARSYAIYFMFSALALWIWTCTRADKKWPAVLFGAAILLGVTFHYYAVMCLVPYALWELICWRPGRRPSARLVAGVIGVVLPAALLAPFILSFSRKFSSGFWNRPSFGEFRAIFPQLFPDGVLLLSLIMLWVVLARRNDKTISLQPMAAGESVGWLFLSILVAGFVLAEVKTNAYYSRYFICVLPGVAVSFACLLWRHFRNAPRVSLGIVLLLTTWGIAKQAGAVVHPASVEPTGTRDYLQLEAPLRGEGKRFFLFSSPLLFLEAQYYSYHPEDCILLLPPDFTQDVDPARNSPDPYLHQRLLMSLSQYYPMQFWQMDDISRHAPQVALIEPTPDVLQALTKAGVKIEMHSAKGLKVAYLQ